MPTMIDMAEEVFMSSGHVPEAAVVEERAPDTPRRLLQAPLRAARWRAAPAWSRSSSASTAHTGTPRAGRGEALARRRQGEASSAAI